MKRHSLLFFTAICALIFGILAPAALPQTAEKPAASQSDEQKKGTGVVPQGVKLAAQMPDGAQPKIFRFPKAATKTLANGTRTFVVTDKEQPMVTVQLVLLNAGSADDPAGKPGVANMTADMLTQGTDSRTAQQIAQAIDFVGGSLNASADKDSTYLSVTVVKRDFALAMDLLSDILLHPSFKKDELDRRRQQALSGLQVQYSDPGYIAGVVLGRLVYAQHPYGLPGIGTPDSLRKIEREDLVRFRETRYTPDRALLAFAGDITAETAISAAEKYLGSAVWPKKGTSAAAPPKPAPVQGLHIFLIDKPDANQTQIRVGRLGIPRNHPDYILLYVTNRIFGGGFNSRLSTEVRQKKGLTYGAYSNFNSYKEAGDFSASTFTRTEATAEATKLVVDLISRMSTGELGPKELDFARDYIAGVFPIQTETGEQVASRIVSVAQYDLPADYNDTYQQKVLAVGPSEVKAMSGRYFDGADLILVLVGNTKQYRDAIRKEFPAAKYEELPFDQVDLLAPDLHKPKPATAAATPESKEKGKSLMLAAAAAAGGLALSKIESVQFTGKGDLILPQGKIAAELNTVLAYPDRMRIDISVPMGTMKTGFDGKAGWLATPQSVMDLPASMAAENLRTIALVAGWGLLRQALENKSEVNYIGEEEVEGRKLAACEWTSPAGPTKLYIDPASGMLIGTRYRQTSMQGTAEQLELWADFKAVEGSQFPFKIVQYREGAKAGEFTVTSIKLNINPEAALFTKPK